MSVGPLGGIAFSLAGSPLAQSTGAGVERSRQETTTRQLQQASNEKAENAAGVGQTDGEEHQTNDRDADGRRIWEIEEAARKQAQARSNKIPPRSAATPRAKAATNSICLAKRKKARFAENFATL